jgi:protein TonB
MKRFCWLLVFMAAGLASADEIARSVPPKVIHTVQTEYTPVALADKVEGSVILSAVVGLDGTPSEIHVVKGLGNGLDQKAVESLTQWRFRPATYDGKPVEMKIQVEIGFRVPKPPVRR